MKIVIIDYKAGNIRSVLFALERLGVNAVLTDDAETIVSADKVIFPGVGEASSAMAMLAGKGLDTVIRNLKQPTLGICLGMQLLCEQSEEGNTSCLGIIPLRVKKFDNSKNPLVKVPEIGWNTISGLTSPLFENVPENTHQYFVHSYYAERGAATIALSDYLVPFSAALQKDNFYGVQFHPEKSGQMGEQILKNFLNIN